MAVQVPCLPPCHSASSFSLCSSLTEPIKYWVHYRCKTSHTLCPTTCTSAQHLNQPAGWTPFQYRGRGSIKTWYQLCKILFLTWIKAFAACYVSLLWMLNLRGVLSFAKNSIFYWYGLISHLVITEFSPIHLWFLNTCGFAILKVNSKTYWRKSGIVT